MIWPRRPGRKSGAFKRKRSAANTSYREANGRNRPVTQANSSSAKPGSSKGIAMIKTRIFVYFTRHAQVFLYSLGRLSQTPASTLMTAAVLGIALALPAGLHVMLKNAQYISQGWDSAAQISLFLQLDIDDDQAKVLGQQLKAMSEIADVSVRSKAQALEEFQRLSSFEDALASLDHNPLPAVLVIHPTAAYSSPGKAEHLLTRLKAKKEVDIAQLDMQWLQRLYAMMELVRRGVQILAGLLAIAVLLIVGNTIRLAIQNQRDEIEVTKLIGGTDAFIRRPFLYSGLWYGVFGGVIAWLLLEFSFMLLQRPVQNLTALYDSQTGLVALDIGTSVLLLASGAILGWLGSWIAVGRHLSEIEPS